MSLGKHSSWLNKKGTVAFLGAVMKTWEELLNHRAHRGKPCVLKRSSFKNIPEQIISCCIEVPKIAGPDLLESVYAI